MAKEDYEDGEGNVLVPSPICIDHVAELKTGNETKVLEFNKWEGNAGHCNICGKHIYKGDKYAAISMKYLHVKDPNVDVGKVDPSLYTN